MRKFVVSLLLGMSLLVPASAQGLRFYGLERQIDERTSLSLFSRRRVVFHDRLDVSFDLQTYSASRYGYLLRFQDKADPSRIWNISYDGRLGPKVFQLNEEGRRCIIRLEFEEEELPDFRWTPLTVSFDAKNDYATLSIGGKSASASVDLPIRKIVPRIHFGLSGHMVDVPSFAIRNLKIGDNRKICSFPLNEVGGVKVHDSRGRPLGRVNNQEWLLNRSMYWSHLAGMQSDAASGYNYDPDKKTVVLYNNTLVKSYNVATGNTTETKTAPCPVHLLLGYNYIEGRQLIAYEPEDWTTKQVTPSVASLDLDSLRWTLLSTDRLRNPLHHHASFKDARGRYTIFGGFGNQTYSRSFHCLDDGGRSWITPDIDSTRISPRFFASAGRDPEGKYVYIFGGMGNESGEQVVGRQYYYDLHRIDLATGECECMWSLDWKGQNVVPIRNLVVMDDCFYTLCYPEYFTESNLHLYKFSLKDGSFERLGDPVTVVSDKIWSSSSLYYDPELERFIVVTHNVDNDLTSILDIYSLTFPPVWKTPSPPYRGRMLRLWIPLGLLILALGIAGTWYLRKRRRFSSQEEGYQRSKTDPRRKLFHEDPRPSSIYLFGPLAVIDRDGNDIIDQFTNQIRAVLLLLIKYRETGMTTLRFSSIMWPDKEATKSKANRGVAINRVRQLLSTLDGVTPVFENGVYKLNFSEGSFCDYISLDDDLTDKSKREEMLRILSRGRFLSDESDELFDSFKGNVESKVIPFLTDELTTRFNAKEYQAAIEIAEMLFRYDPLDENALKYIVNSLHALRRREDAMVQYTRFITEYQRINDESYPIPFEKI